jgi:diaminohydroxyphosphoribosylaminopyrimidine deaminase/5-amino-6-(5-phosphoribosylamino)uracil reductase
LLARDPIVYGAGETRVDITSALKDLGEQNILSVLVEGGPTVARSFVDAQVVDEFVWYIAGKVAGGTGMPAIGGIFETLSDATDVEIVDVASLGGGVRITAVPVRGDH